MFPASFRHGITTETFGCVIRCAGAARRVRSIATIGSQQQCPFRGTDRSASFSPSLGYPRPSVRICVVYDCLYPHTVGGAERWYRNLSRRLVEAGHDVTYLTLRQWDSGVEPSFDGVRVVPV